MIAEHVGREVEFEALGRKWRLARWTRAVWRDLLKRARELIPDPLAGLEGPLAVLPKEYGELLLARAIERRSRYLSVNSPEVQSFLDSIEGMTCILYLLLRQYQPDVTEDVAYDVALAAGDRLPGLLQECAGRGPAGNP